VNVAAFHPVPGAGIVYGTKEGKLRTLKYDRSVTVDRPPLLTNSWWGATSIKCRIDLRFFIL
jgi:hypothetical protein